MSATPTCDFEKQPTVRIPRTAVASGGEASGQSQDRKWDLAYSLDSELTEDEDQRLRRLLVSCFPSNPLFWFRRFYLERPMHRWLARNAAGHLVGHAAVHEKIVGTKCGELRIGGVAEVCVAANHRGLGILKGMLHTAHEWMADRELPFAMLFGQPRIYASSGYVTIENELRASNSIVRRWVPNRGKPMVKALAGLAWPEGSIDLRGPTF